MKIKPSITEKRFYKIPLQVLYYLHTRNLQHVPKKSESENMLMLYRTFYDSHLESLKLMRQTKNSSDKIHPSALSIFVLFLTYQIPLNIWLSYLLTFYVRCLCFLCARTSCTERKDYVKALYFFQFSFLNAFLFVSLFSRFCVHQQALLLTGRLFVNFYCLCAFCIIKQVCN